MKDPILSQLVTTLEDQMGETYPLLIMRSEIIKANVLKEEKQFALTLEQGMQLLESELENLEGNKISRFIEKPDLELAKALIKDKRFTWSSGRFMFKAKTIIEDAKKIAKNYEKEAKIKLEESLERKKKLLSREW